MFYSQQYVMKALHKLAELGMSQHKEKREVNAVCVHSAEAQWWHEPKCAHISSKHYSLEQWSSAFLMLWPFNTLPHVVTPNDKIILLLLQLTEK